MRKLHPAFRMSTLENEKKYLKFIDLGEKNIVAYTLTNPEDSWKNILVILNGNRHSKRVVLPAGTWNVICHDGFINPNSSTLMQIKSQNFIVAPSSASIMYLAPEEVEVP